MELVLNGIPTPLFIVLVEIASLFVGIATARIATKAQKLIARFMIRRGQGMRLRDLNERVNIWGWLRARAVPLTMVVPAIVVGIGAVAGPAFAATLYTTTLERQAGMETVVRHLGREDKNLSCLARFRFFPREEGCTTRLGVVLEREHDDFQSARSRLLTWGTGPVRRTPAVGQLTERSDWVTYFREGTDYVSLDRQLRTPGRVSDELVDLEVEKSDPVVTLATASRRDLFSIRGDLCTVRGAEPVVFEPSLLLRNIAGTGAAQPLYEAEWSVDNSTLVGTTLFVTIFPDVSGRWAPEISDVDGLCEFVGVEYLYVEVGVEYTQDECKKIQQLRDVFIAKGVSSCTSTFFALMPTPMGFFDSGSPSRIQLLTGASYLLGWKQGGLRRPDVTFVQLVGVYSDIPPEYSAAARELIAPTEEGAARVALTFMAGELRQFGTTTQPAKETVVRMALTWPSIVVAAVTVLVLAVGLAIPTGRGLPVPTNVMTAYQAGCADGRDWGRGCAEPWKVDDQGLVWGVMKTTSPGLDHLGFVDEPTTVSNDRPLARTRYKTAGRKDDIICNGSRPSKRDGDGTKAILESGEVK